MGLVLLSILISNCKKDVPEGPSSPDDTPVVEETGNSVIPYIHINTLGNEIQNEPKVPAELRILANDEEIFYTHIGIEYRGSTSFRISNKKSFGIETWDADGNDIDLSFFGFPEEEDWILNWPCCQP